MAVHTATFAIPRESLLAIAESRCREAEALRKAGFHAGAMFLGGCALECYLKAAICLTLRLDGLPAVFKTHGFESLILYSGFDKALSREPKVRASFDSVVQTWKKDGHDSLLYRLPEEATQEMADQFMRQLTDEQTVVLPWLQRMAS